MTTQNAQVGEPFKVEPVRQPGSLASHVADQLEKMVTQGAIAVGQKLPTENALCEMFGVSRTVIREAVAKLKSLGLVETKRGVGTTVIRNAPAETFYARSINPTAVEDILHILELRMVVESAAASLAAQRHDAEDMARIESALKAFHEARARHELARKEDYEFHLSIAIATKNPFIRSFFEQYNKNIIPRAKILNANIDQAASEKYLKRVEDEHLELFEAIKARNAEAASAAMHEHLFRAYHLYEKYKSDDATG